MRKNYFSFILCFSLNVLIHTNLHGGPGLYVGPDNHLEDQPHLSNALMEDYKMRIQNRNNSYVLVIQDKSEDLEFLNQAAVCRDDLYEELSIKFKTFYSKLKQELQKQLISHIPDPKKWDIHITGVAFFAGLGIGANAIWAGDIGSGFSLIAASLGAGKILWSDYKNAKGSLNLIENLYFKIPFIHSSVQKMPISVLNNRIHEIAIGSTIKCRQRIKNSPLEELENEILNLTTFLMGQFGHNFQEENNLSLYVLNMLDFYRF